MSSSDAAELAHTLSAQEREPPDRQLPYDGQYRVQRTSGSSGRRGLFVYDAAGWAGNSRAASTSRPRS